MELVLVMSAASVSLTLFFSFCSNFEVWSNDFLNCQANMWQIGSVDFISKHTMIFLLNYTTVHTLTLLSQL